MKSSVPRLEGTKKWCFHAEAAPILTKGRDGRLRIAANGTRSCSGGWELRYGGVVPGAVYHIEMDVSYDDLDHPREMVGATVTWGTGRHAPVDRLIPKQIGPHARRLVRIMQAPPGTDSMTIRCFLRWSPKGTSSWKMPLVRPASMPRLRPARVCLVTGSLPRVHEREVRSIEDNIRFYGEICEQAAKAVKPDLMVLPEIALHLGSLQGPFKSAVTIPSKETNAFAGIARKHRTHLVLGLYEREDDAVFNCALLFGRKGQVIGKYHKVHLAPGEDLCGLLPGDSFPVFSTDIGTIGFNICMDTSAAESSRMVGLNGADYLVMPIMGDHRADRHSPGPPVYNDDRWRAIMRVHAMDNQLTMVVARNEGEGSCVIDRKGAVLAYNEGDLDYVWADVPARQPFRKHSGYCNRDTNWWQRRPHLYGPFVDESNYGNMRIIQTTGEP